MDLPRFAVFHVATSDMYLQYGKEDGRVHGFIRLCNGGEGVMSPYARHQVEMEKSGKGRVHIRCSFNNKYWRLESKTSWWIVAAADEPEEDESKWYCTLIHPQIVHGKTYKFYHVRTNRMLAGRHYGPDIYLQATTGDARKCHQFTFTDWESLVKLPKHVAFKGNNHKYIVCLTDQRVEFGSDHIGDPTNGLDVVTNPDGSIRLKSNNTGRFWSLDPDCFIKADAADDSASSSRTMFWPIQVKDNVVALRSMSNGQICVRAEKDFLCANSPTITMGALIEVEELLISRKNIYDVNYDLANVTIYNKTEMVVAQGYAVNETNEDKMVEVKVACKDNRSKKWSSYCSLKIGLKAPLEAKIPFLVDDHPNFDFSAVYSGEYEWGETLETTDTVDNHYQVYVAAKTTLKVVVKATKAYCDIPFTYRQRDILTNGEEVVARKEDGIYTTSNLFHYECKPVQRTHKSDYSCLNISDQDDK